MQNTLTPRFGELILDYRELTTKLLSNKEMPPTSCYLNRDTNLQAVRNAPRRKPKRLRWRGIADFCAHPRGDRSEDESTGEEPSHRAIRIHFAAGNLGDLATSVPAVRKTVEGQGYLGEFKLRNGNKVILKSGMTS